MSSDHSDSPVVRFEDFHIRTDKSNERVTNPTPWNWTIGAGDRIAVMTSNPYLRYQLILVMAGLVPSVSGRQVHQGVVGWPLGGEGGLDSKLPLRHNLDFVCQIYGDCLHPDLFSIEAFWQLLAEQDISPGQCVRDLNSPQKSIFFTALSVLFAFDLSLIPKTRFLMSKAGASLRRLFLEQSQGRALLATSNNARFLRQFCNQGLVLSPSGDLLFQGPLEEALVQFEQMPGHGDAEESDDPLIQGLNLQNSDRKMDDQDDIL